MAIATAAPLQHITIRRWLAEFVASATRTVMRTRHQSPHTRSYPPRREEFVEEAAMAREVLKL
jgi:hypothetical protein